MTTRQHPPVLRRQADPPVSAGVHFQTKPPFGWLLKGLVLCFVCSLANPVDAHHGHVSLTEIEWNSESQRFEVAIRLRIADLEDAISLQLERRFRLETDPQRDDHVRAYLQQHFSVTFDGDSLCRLNWVGCDLELHDVWVYFEAESIAADSPLSRKPSADDRWRVLFAPSTPARTARPVSLHNSVLTDVRPRQANVIAFKVGRRSITKTLTVQDPAGELP